MMRYDFENGKYHFDKDLEGINLFLKVGNQKMYVVQNLYKFKTLFLKILYIIIFNNLNDYLVKVYMKHMERIMVFIIR